MADLAPGTVGQILVRFQDTGNVSVEIDGKVNYMQQYGVAETLREMARMEQAQQAMASLMGEQSGKIIPVRGMPQMGDS